MYLDLTRRVPSRCDRTFRWRVSTLSLWDALRSVAELRRSLPHEFNDGVLRLAAEDVVGDVRDLHGAVIQVASQFNALEMIHPDVTPEMGVDRYELDRTQGPICAIAWRQRRPNGT